MRKKRAKYTWLPMVGFQDDNNLEESVFVGQSTLGVLAGTPIRSQTDVRPLVLDLPQEAVHPGAIDSLSDLIGSDYICKRIVGSIWAAYNTPVANTPASCIVTVGIFVARVDSAIPILPIGAAVPADLQENYSPLGMNNAREPWMFHRSWMLGQPNSTSVTLNPFRNAPITNADYGELRSGPHVDCKSARRIRGDERLFIACQATNIIGDGAATGDVIVQWSLRALGQLRKAHNRSTF